MPLYGIEPTKVEIVTEAWLTSWLDRRQRCPNRLLALIVPLLMMLPPKVPIFTVAVVPVATPPTKMAAASVNPAAMIVPELTIEPPKVETATEAPEPLALPPTTMPAPEAAMNPALLMLPAKVETITDEAVPIALPPTMMPLPLAAEIMPRLMMPPPKLDTTTDPTTGSQCRRR